MWRPCGAESHQQGDNFYFQLTQFRDSFIIFATYTLGYFETQVNSAIKMLARVFKSGVLKKPLNFAAGHFVRGLSVNVSNPHLVDLESDFLYHLGLSSSDDLKAMFGDVRFLCVGGSSHRIEAFADSVVNELGPKGDGVIDLPEDLEKLEPVGKTERFSMYACDAIT